MHENFLRPDVPVVLDRERHFRIDFQALIDIQEILGSHPQQDESGVKIPIARVREVLAAALRHEDPSITPELVGEHISVANLQEVMEAFSRAWRLAMGEEGHTARPLLRALLQ